MNNSMVFMLTVVLGGPTLAQTIVKIPMTQTLSESRDRLAATTAGTKAFFAGGRTGPTAADKSAVIDVYDFSLGLPSDPAAWSTPHTLTQARSHLSATTVDSFAIFAGGDPGVGGSDVIDFFNSVTDSWGSYTLPSGGGAGMAATTVGTKALFAGGNLGGAYQSAVDIYDSSLGAPTNPTAWSTASLSEGRAFLAATTVADRWAVFGGGEFGSPTYTDTVDIYDNLLNSWSTASLSQPRSDLAAISLGGKALFAGGGNPTASDVVDLYNTDPFSSWSTDTLSEARLGLAAATLSDIGLFAGGESSFSDTVDLYYANSGSWLSGPALSEARRFLSGTSVGSYVLFAGGSGTSGFSDTIDVYAVPLPSALLMTLIGITVIGRLPGLRMGQA